jgi:thioredoxin:protein disulfide reductase
MVITPTIYNGLTHKVCNRSTMLKQFFAIIYVLTLMFVPQISYAQNASNIGRSLFTEDNNSDEFLSPDEAFKLTLNQNGANSVNAYFNVEPGYYLYKDRIKFSITSENTGQILQVELPEGEIKNDPNFGSQSVFHHDFIAKLTLIGATAPTIKATYQGCSEKGLCYAPQTKTVTLTAINENNPANNSNNTFNAANYFQTEDDKATALLKGGKLWLIIAGFFGFGLLLALTPCVLPMIPILSGIIVGDKKLHHHATSRLHAFNLSLSYVMGMALSYTIAGILAGLSGQLLSNALQSPIVLGATALVFVGLAFSMFGFYELRLPNAVETKMVRTANRLKGGQFLGVFIMGALSALIVSPCVAAPLAGALLYISQTHDVVLGGVALFALSIGMGVPLLLIGASAGHVLPKAGSWMTAVRNFFGVVMLGVAIYLISPIIPSMVQMILWSALFIIPAIYLHALDNLPKNNITGTTHPWMRFWKGIGIMMLVMGIAILIGGLMGSQSPLNPLSNLQFKSTKIANDGLRFTRINSLASLDTAIKAAKGKVVMLDFYADWCVACKEMEQTSFRDSHVKNALSKAVLLQVDVTNNTEEDTKLLSRFMLFGPPGIIFFNQVGQEIKPLKVVGYQEPSVFLASVNRVIALKPDECNPVITC